MYRLPGFRGFDVVFFPDQDPRSRTPLWPRLDAWRFRPDTGNSSLKQPLSTFIESVAVAAMLQLDKQTLHGLDPINRRLKLH
jgi:hypothetical protein